MPADAQRQHVVLGIDPGHGGSNNGARAELDGKWYSERDLTLRIAIIAKAMLPEVYLTRSFDERVSFAERRRRMRRCNVDVVVSIHFDSTPWSPESHGTHGYYRKGDVIGCKLAQYACEHAPSELRIGSRGVICAHNGPSRQDDWLARAQVVTTAFEPAPTALLELGYMSNQDDLRYILSREGGEACAKLVIATLEMYRHWQTGLPPVGDWP
jgi:N-acetylmuramoyl-L-alanine amidase